LSTFGGTARAIDVIGIEQLTDTLDDVGSPIPVLATTYPRFLIWIKSVLDADKGFIKQKSMIL